MLFRSKANTYVQRLQEACNFVKNKIQERPDIGIILGSGLGSYGDELINPIKIPYHEIPDMLDTTVPGHSGCLIYGKVGDRKVLCLSGRSHQYEGLAPHEVQFAVRLLALCGCRLVILTNAAGTRDPELDVGGLTPMIDHVNTTHRGYTEETFSFKKDFNHLIQTDMYDADALKVAKEVAIEMGLGTKGCVYTYNFGPTYETSAEVEGEFKVGVTNFGMSTVPEVIALKELGVPVFAMSFVTNKAAGYGGEILSHEDVAKAAKAGESKMRALISQVIIRTPLQEFPIPVLEGDDHNISLAIPKSFVTEAEIETYAKQFGETQIDALVILGACHKLEGFNVNLTVDCNELPNFPILQHTSLKFNIGVYEGKQIGVIEGFHNLTGLEEHALYYIIKLAKKLGASTYIQTLQAGAFGEKGVAVVDDVIPFYEHPIVVPELCGCSLKYEIDLPKAILGSYHGPEFPSTGDVTVLKRSGATHIALGTIKGLMIAKAVGLKTVGLVDGAYNCYLTSEDKIENILKACRESSTGIAAAIKKVVDNVQKVAKIGGTFQASETKAIQWNDTPSRIQNSQQDPAVVNAITEKLPSADLVLLFNTVSKYFLELKEKVSNEVEIEGRKIYTGKIFEKNVILSTTDFSLIRAFAQKGIPVLAIGCVIPVDKTISDKYVTIYDHINLTGKNALVGKNKFGDRFPDCSSLYTVVPNLKKFIQFNLIDLRETTNAYLGMINAFGADAASDFGSEEAVVYHHSKGTTFKQIAAVVKCPKEEWTIDETVLKSAF